LANFRGILWLALISVVPWNSVEFIEIRWHGMKFHGKQRPLVMNADRAAACCMGISSVSQAYILLGVIYG